MDSRKYVHQSLKTESESVAIDKVRGVWANLIDGWEALLRGDSSDAEERFQAAQEIAQQQGFRYLPMSKVMALSDEKLAERIEAIAGLSEQPAQKKIVAAAVLGVVDKPKITLSRALELFWGMSRDRLHGKSENQIRKWKNPRKKAISNYIEVVGDLDIAEITAEDMIDFVNWWQDRIEEEDLTPNSANKDITHLSGVLKTVNKKKKLGLTLPLGDLMLKEAEARQRPSFSVKWIKEKLLAPGALDGLNKQARCLVLGMINTGYRPSEGACATGGQIVLDAPVPHLSIEPSGRTLKNFHSRRVIPLLGVSLEAFKECPEGFPRYADSDTLSATVNKYFKEHGLKETPHHTMYSLRHSFEERLLAADVDERIRADLMGHGIKRERYGQGATLEHQARILAKIAL